MSDARVAFKHSDILHCSFLCSFSIGLYGERHVANFSYVLY